jgi:hypothetical protein
VVEAREWITDVSSSEDSSDEDDVAGIAISSHDAPLPPPPMCLMARGNLMVSGGESDSDNEFDSNEFSNLIHEYTCIIKRKKGKVKKFESAHSHLTMTCLQSTMYCSRSMMSHLYLPKGYVRPVISVALCFFLKANNTTAMRAITRRPPATAIPAIAPVLICDFLPPAAAPNTESHCEFQAVLLLEHKCNFWHG